MVLVCREGKITMLKFLVYDREVTVDHNWMAEMNAGLDDCLEEMLFNQHAFSFASLIGASRSQNQINEVIEMCK